MGKATLARRNSKKISYPESAYVLSLLPKKEWADPPRRAKQPGDRGR